MLRLGISLENRHRDVICTTSFVLSIKTVDRRLSTRATSDCESKGLLFTTVK